MAPGPARQDLPHAGQRRCRRALASWGVLVRVVVPRDVVATAVGGGGACNSSCSSSLVAAASPGVALDAQTVPCSFTVLRLSDLVPTPPRRYVEVPLVALRSWGSRSCRRPELPSFHSTHPTLSYRVISPSPRSWPTRTASEDLALCCTPRT